MKKCDICDKPFVFSERGWRTVKHRQVQSCPDLVSYALTVRQGGPVGEPAKTPFPRDARDAYLTEAEARLPAGDWLLCGKCAAVLDQCKPEATDDAIEPIETGLEANAPVPLAEVAGETRKRRRPASAPVEAEPERPERPARKRSRPSYREFPGIPGVPAWAILMGGAFPPLILGVILGRLAIQIEGLSLLCILAGVGCSGVLLSVALVTLVEDLRVPPMRICFLKAILGLTVPLLLAVLSYPNMGLTGVFIVMGLAIGGWFVSAGATILQEQQRQLWAEEDLRKEQARPVRGSRRATPDEREES